MTASATPENYTTLTDVTKKRGRFSSEPLDQIKTYTALEWRYLAHAITGLRDVLHGIKLDCAPDMKPIDISKWYGPGAVLKNLDIIKNHYGDDIRGRAFVRPSGGASRFFRWQHPTYASWTCTWS